ncbi:MAG: potassium channel beta subunit family protein [Nitriliruptoraceae bacterium]
MPYRRLGPSGLKVSVLSFGSWVTFKDQVDVGAAVECMAAAHEAGVNLYDNAEVYAGGESERIMGEALRRLGWPRHSYVLTSKFFWGIHDGVNTRNTLNRKYLMEAIPAALERFGLEHLDVVYAHRADPATPIAETVRAFSDAIDRGWAHYWGTSEWSAYEIREALDVAERTGLHAPITEQPQYHLLHRERMEVEYRRLFDDTGYGTTTWSPLASGMLTGKYLDGVPDGSRAALPGYEWLAERLKDPRHNDRIRALIALAGELDASPAQLAIAWCAANPDVSSVITGASRPAQVVENMGALAVLPRLDADVMARIDGIFAPPKGV